MICLESHGGWSGCLAQESAHAQAKQSRALCRAGRLFKVGRVCGAAALEPALPCTALGTPVERGPQRDVHGSWPLAASLKSPGEPAFGSPRPSTPSHTRGPHCPTRQQQRDSHIIATATTATVLEKLRQHCQTPEPRHLFMAFSSRIYGGSLNRRSR